MKLVPMITATALILGGCAAAAAPTATDEAVIAPDAVGLHATYHVMAGGGGGGKAN